MLSCLLKATPLANGSAGLQTQANETPKSMFPSAHPAPLSESGVRGSGPTVKGGEGLAVFVASTWQAPGLRREDVWSLEGLLLGCQRSSLSASVWRKSRKACGSSAHPSRLRRAS